MSSRPVISVVIPTYNRANDLKRALNSVQAQTFTNWELIVVDNHSVDDTDQVVNDFNDSRIRLFKVHNNGVIAASRNVGIREASGEYIAFLDSDDWWKPEKLRLSLDALNAGADIVYHDLLVVSKVEQRIFLKKAITRGLTRPVFDNLLSTGNCINNSSVVVKKSILISIGGISEDHDLIAAEDYDCWLRVAQKTEKFSRIPKSLGYYWMGGGNISNPERTVASIDAIVQRYINSKSRESTGGVLWIHYSRGRAYYLLCNWKMAKKYLGNINWPGTPLMLYVKSQWMLQVIRLVHENKS